MAETTTNYPLVVPMPPMEPKRAADVAELLVGAVDLHCHSGPAAMPRILGHHEAFKMALDAKFKALLYKDHYYVGMPHCAVLKDIYPDAEIELYSGVALNNASGGSIPTLSTTTSSSAARSSGSRLLRRRTISRPMRRSPSPRRPSRCCRPFR